MKKVIVFAAAVTAIACAEPTMPSRMSVPASGLADLELNAASSGFVLPSGFASLMGANNFQLPHSFRNVRYQQVFLGSDVTSPVIIGVCLRRDEVGGGTERTQTLAVKIGPTLLDHTNLGRVFDTNYSAPPTEVFVGDILVPANVAGGTPADFDLCIPFTTEYTHPAGSNLIVEVINTSLSSGFVPKDGCLIDQAACTTARAQAFSPIATSASFVERGGLIMKFVVPEPPVPTDPVDREECMKAGWSVFGFRNQGQCVKFVETGEDSRNDGA